MKNKFLVVAIVALLLACGMVLVSCGNCPGDGKCEIKSGTEPSSASEIAGWCFNRADLMDDDEALDKAITDCFGDGTSFPLTCGC